MNGVRALLWGSFAFSFLMISAGSSPALAASEAGGGGKRSFKPVQQRHPGLRPEAPWISIILRHRSELNLTAEQVATLEQLRSDFEQQVTPKRTDLRNAEREIERLLQEQPVDLVRVKAKVEEVEKLRAEFRYLRIETLERGKSVLTAEQRDRLENLTFSHHGRFRRPRGEAS